MLCLYYSTKASAAPSCRGWYYCDGALVSQSHSLRAHGVVDVCGTTRHPMPPSWSFDQFKCQYEVEIGQTGRYMDIVRFLSTWLSISEPTTGREPPRA